MPFLSMIVRIKGIYLITGLLNYSSVEARLFGRVLIVLLGPWHAPRSAAPGRAGAGQRGPSCRSPHKQRRERSKQLLQGEWMQMVFQVQNFPGFCDAAFHLFPFVS